MYALAHRGFDHIFALADSAPLCTEECMCITCYMLTHDALITDLGDEQDDWDWYEYDYEHYSACGCWSCLYDVWNEYWYGDYFYQPKLYGWASVSPDDEAYYLGYGDYSLYSLEQEHRQECRDWHEVHHLDRSPPLEDVYAKIARLLAA